MVVSGLSQKTRAFPSGWYFQMLYSDILQTEHSYPLRSLTFVVLQCLNTVVLGSSPKETPPLCINDVCKKPNDPRTPQLATSIWSTSSSFSAGGDRGAAPFPLLVAFSLSSFATAAALSCIWFIQSLIDSGGPPSIRIDLSSAGIPRTVPWYRDSSPVLLCFFFRALEVPG